MLFKVSITLRPPDSMILIPFLLWIGGLSATNWSLTDIPTDLVRNIMEFADVKSQNCLARTCLTYYSLAQQAWHKSWELDDAVNLPSLQFIPYHQDFEILEGFEFQIIVFEPKVTL